MTPRREFLFTIASALASSLPSSNAKAAAKLPANQNVKWAVSSALWNHFEPGPLTDILDVMRDTGFPGLRLTSFPAVLDKYAMTAPEMQREVSKRNLEVVTISFNGPMHLAERREDVLNSAKRAIEFLKGFGASHLVIFTPARLKPGEDVDTAFRQLCERCNQIGELAGTLGFTVGVHNHLDQMVERPEEIHRLMANTDPKLCGFSPDTAHLLLGGSNVVDMVTKYKDRIRFLDYKDARPTAPDKDWVEPNGTVLAKDSKMARFLSSIYDLGDGDIDFPGCHRALKSVSFKGWICVDLDTARKGPQASYERCGAYVTSRLEPIYK
jgi:inosose dehydratase